jgi:hypothetical protein
MKRPRAAATKLTATQFRMLQRIPDEGLPQTALRQRHGYGIAAQLRTLRILVLLDLVVETQNQIDEVWFETTDAGRKLVRQDSAG